MKIKYLCALLLVFTISFTCCKSDKKNEASAATKKDSVAIAETSLKVEDFDTIIDEKHVELFWLENDSIKAAFTNYGGRLVGLWVPDKNGKMIDVVVGMNSAEGFANSTEPYFGATIGRVGNRIAKGRFKLNGKIYNIPKNNKGNTLHGGIKGFQDVVWDVEKQDDSSLVLHYKSPDMEEGFPGNLDVTVTYSLTSQRSVKMEYEATTDKATPVNLTNHAFFNLNGEGNGKILDHTAQIYADQFTPVDTGLIPIGELKDVKNTPFDFTAPHTIGERIETENEQLKNGAGYDHNFVLSKTQVGDFNKAATVTGDESGIVMEIFTEEPGLQFYSGNFMQSKNKFKSGAKDDYRTAFAMETQHFPDAPNQPDFQQITLEPGDTYHTLSEYKFSTINNY